MKIKNLTLLLLPLLVVAPLSYAQHSSSSAGQQSGSSSAGNQNGDMAGPGGLGFSIESEMLTYKSLEADSEALACDIARYLYGGDIGDPTPTAPCSIQVGTKPRMGVVLVSSTSTLLADFQVWRADMAAMNSLQLRASKFCTPEGQPIQGTVHSRGTSSKGSPLDFTPAGSMLGMVGTALGMFATTSSTSAVGGTIHDPALMNAVARQLNSLNVSVLAPDTYTPFSLAGSDFSNSPFLSNLAQLMNTRVCLQAAKDVTPTPARTDEINSLVGNIDSFIAMVNGDASSTAGSAPAGAAHPPSAASAQSSPATPSPSHLAAILKADGLARAIGINGDGTEEPSSIWQHILWLAALESGGSVSHEGNIFGSKVRFSGGAVVTYAIFTLDGTLGCSGNVFDFEGSLRPQDFATSFHKPGTEPKKQLATVRGTCSPAK